jgi:predicted SprT family Zn-dependent metalloprotease
VSYDTKDPTRVTYIGFTEAFDRFNAELFSGELPPTLITMQRRRGSYGYFASKRFGTRDRSVIVGEIALNPIHFEERSDDKTLPTLTHEMCHHWQEQFGKPSRNGYHNREWAAKMKSVGLKPDNGNGRETGQAVSHHIIPGGPFDRACAKLLEGGAKIEYVDIWGQRQSAKAKLRTKYTCEECGANAWGKPDLRIDCRDCQKPMKEDAQVATDFVLHDTEWRKC